MTGAWTDAGGRAIVTLVSGGPLIGRRAARELARRELAEVSFWERILRSITRLFNSAGGTVPPGWFGLIVLASLAVLVIIVVLFWVRPARAHRASADPVLTGKSRTAQDYRREAQRLAAARDYAGAIVDGVRAIAAELDERGILPPGPGRTADELAFEAGRELPALAADLLAVTRLFDDVRYGDKDGSMAGYELVTRVDADLRSAQVASQPAPPALTGIGAPQ